MQIVLPVSGSGGDDLFHIRNFIFATQTER